MEHGIAQTASQNPASTLCMGCMQPATQAATCPHCGWNNDASAEAVPHLPPGTLLHDTYLVGRVLGQDGFGITYLAWDIRLQRKMAIKEYFPQGTASRQMGSCSVVPLANVRPFNPAGSILRANGVF